MSVEKISFYLRDYDRDRVIELLEQKDELLELLVANVANPQERDDILATIGMVHRQLGNVLANKSVGVLYAPKPKTEEEE